MLLIEIPIDVSESLIKCGEFNENNEDRLRPDLFIFAQTLLIETVCWVVIRQKNEYMQILVRSIYAQKYCYNIVPLLRESVSVEIERRIAAINLIRLNVG